MGGVPEGATVFDGFPGGASGEDTVASVASSGAVEGAVLGASANIGFVAGVPEGAIVAIVV